MAKKHKKIQSCNNFWGMQIMDKKYHFISSKITPINKKNYNKFWKDFEKYSNTFLNP